jgi:NAD(P)-dependent dehydrogenase (short-subunit alcohol dehydrogenase family)
LDLQLRGRNALVTGASKGIGHSVAQLLSEEGCNLFLVARNARVLESAAGEIRARQDVNVLWLAADLGQEADRKRVADWAAEADILVNNAGAIPGGNLLTITDETWRAGWELKVFGYISLCRLLYPRMATRNRGAIINIIGAAGERADPEYIAGVAGNAALMAFTRALGKMSPKDGIRVLGINPGVTATDRARELFAPPSGSHAYDVARWTEIQSRLPFGRAATSGEIAAAVAFLASERSGYTSGCILTINAGN